MQGIFLNCSPPSALFRTGFYGVLPHFFRFFRHFWSQGGSCYQNSVKACPTTQVWSQRFWSVEISDVSSPFSNTAKRWKEVWNGYFHEDAETFGDRIRLGRILRKTSIKEFFEMHFWCSHFADDLLPPDYPDQILLQTKQL